jgi:hypothetical protein
VFLYKPYICRTHDHITSTTAYVVLDAYTVLGSSGRVQGVEVQCCLPAASLLLAAPSEFVCLKVWTTAGYLHFTLTASTILSALRGLSDGLYNDQPPLAQRPSVSENPARPRLVYLYSLQDGTVLSTTLTQ